MAQNKITKLEIGEEYLTIEQLNREPLILNFQWLRDHCRCDACFHTLTNQRNLALLDFPASIKPRYCNVCEDSLCITWFGGHESKYYLDWLEKFSRFKADLLGFQKVSWLKSPDVARIDVSTFMNTRQGLIDVMESLLRFGVAFVTSVTPTLEATETVVRKIAPVQKTLFGEMWELNHDFVEVAHKDTAYSKDGLGAHTDNTYWSDAAGLQVFHLFKQAERGGETLLIDGLKVVEELKTETPECYERLTRVPVGCEYKEDDQWHRHVDPIIKIDPVTRELQQFRYNIYDRSPVQSIRQTEIKQHYEDLRLLGRKIKNPEREWWLRLSPGEVIFVDNWRVLHGRAAYSGTRHIVGCYVSRTDWLSRASVLGLIS